MLTLLLLCAAYATFRALDSAHALALQSTWLAVASATFASMAGIFHVMSLHPVPKVVALARASAGSNMSRIS